MPIQVGDKVPSVTLYEMGEEGLVAVNTDEFFAGRKIALFALPGAFTPTCSAQHVPGFVNNADEIKGKGVDAIACLATNDAFDLSERGLGVRSRRYAMIVEDGTITTLNMEDGGGLTISSAESILEAL